MYFFYTRTRMWLFVLFRIFEKRRTAWPVALVDESVHLPCSSPVEAHVSPLEYIRCVWLWWEFYQSGGSRLRAWTELESKVALGLQSTEEGSWEKRPQKKNMFWEDITYPLPCNCKATDFWDLWVVGDWQSVPRAHRGEIYFDLVLYIPWVSM